MSTTPATTLAQIALAAVCLAASAAGHAQVFKCRTPSGEMAYTDKPCSGNSAGRMIEAERTEDEKQADSRKAAEAEWEKQGRRRQEQEQERRQQREDARRRYDAAVSAPRHKGYAERLAERNASVGSKTEVLDNRGLSGGNGARCVRYGNTVSCY